MSENIVNIEYSICKSWVQSTEEQSENLSIHVVSVFFLNVPRKSELKTPCLR